jgi:hypothetical protein
VRYLQGMPSDWSQKLRARAAQEGLSVSDFLLKGTVAERPTMKELAERIASRTPVKYKISPTEIIREERDRRAAALMRNHLGE